MEGGGQPSKHSNLEVAQPGLEYDRHSNAPHAILEGDGNASQVTPGLVEKESRNPPQTSGTGAPFWSRRIWWIALSIAAAAVIAIGIGVGVGVGLKNNQNGAPQSSTASTTQPSQPQPSAPATSSAPSPHSIANGTFLASLVRLNGERHVFFQEESGIIRDAIYEGENWGAPTSYVVATDARNNTPLAAFNVPPGTDVSDERLHLFYVGNNNTLLDTILEEEWGPGFPVLTNGTSEITIANSPETLSVIFSQDEIGSNYSMMAFYRDSSATWHATNGLATNLSFEGWEDSILESTLRLEGASIQSPIIGCSNTPDVGYSISDLQTFVTTLNGSQYSIGSIVNDDPTLSGYSALDLEYFGGDPVPPSIADSDLTCNYIYSPTFGSSGSRALFWVNGTTLSPFDSDIDVVPAFTFPYKRLTAVTPINSTQLFLYAQFNGSIFTEHVYDLSKGHWTSNNISIEIN